MKRIAIVAALGVGSAVAHAQAPAPAVDVADLPPLPAAEDDPSSSATVLAAAAADEDVVVGAAKREQSLGNVASAVTVVSGDRIRRFGYRTIGEAVAAVAGVYLVDNRLSYSIGIRGLQVPGDFNTRVLVLVDGASINESWGAYAGVGFDAIVGVDDIARIEVIRGPVSSVYGTNAFFGIINIVTKGAAESARAWGRAGVHSINGVTTSAGFAAGRVDQQLRGGVHVMDRFGEAVRVEGMRVPADLDGSRSIAAGLVGVYGGSFLQLRTLYFDRESPFAPYDVPFEGPPYNQINLQLLVEGGHTRELSKRFTLATRGYGNFYNFEDTSPPFDPTTGAALDTTGTARTIGAEIRGRYEIVLPDRLGITSGIEGSYNRTRSTAYTVDAPDDLIADVPINYNLLGVYSELDGQPLPWLGFTAGLRFDVHSELQDKLSPRAALFVAKPERYGAKLLYAEGFRNPSAYEAYFTDETDFIADPDALRAETIRSFEVVAWAKPAPGLSTRISGFYWDARDIIEQAPPPPPADQDLLQFQNVTRYVSRGVEVEGSYRTAQGWYGFAGAAFAQVGTEDEMGELVYGGVTNAPRISGGAGVSTPRILDIAHLSAEGVVIGPRPTRPDIDGNESPESPAWLGVNVTVYAPNVRGFDITASVRNVIGKRDLMPAPGDYDRTQPEDLVLARVPGEGREVYVKVGYSY